MKKFIPFLILIFLFLFPRISLSKSQNSLPTANDTEKVKRAATQYQDALERIKNNTPRFMNCLKAKECTLTQIELLKQSLETNLGIMKASLITMTGLVRGVKLLDSIK